MIGLHVQLAKDPSSASMGTASFLANRRTSYHTGSGIPSTLKAVREVSFEFLLSHPAGLVIYARRRSDSNSCPPLASSVLRRLSIFWPRGGQRGLPSSRRTGAVQSLRDSHARQGSRPPRRTPQSRI